MLALESRAQCHEAQSAPFDFSSYSLTEEGRKPRPFGAG